MISKLSANERLAASSSPDATNLAPNPQRASVEELVGVGKPGELGYTAN